MTQQKAKTHPHQDRIMRVIDYIHSHASADLSLEQLADVAAMSRFHWHRVFTAVMGAPPAVIIRTVRMHKATMLLLRTDMSVAKVGAAVGYPNKRRFDRTFKDAYGQSPAAFRAAGLASDEISPSVGEHPMFTVETLIAPAKRLAALSHVGDYSEGSICYQKVATIITTGGHWSHVRGMVGIYYDNPDVTPTNALRSHAGVLWEGDDVPAGLEDVAIAGGRYAVLHFKGPYIGLQKAYRYLYGDWLTETNEPLRDAPCYEVYLNDPTCTPQDELLTDIYMPLAD
ncbi:GyrI-like domain-containing protein [Loktanella agnita]|uniref:AraC family transcriptional regulator n=1 Tax=Loktanella agnita TaxID=287097 RepID=UPI0039887211